MAAPEVEPTVGGRTMKEVAELLGRSLRSTERDWRLARAWLCTELRRG